MRGTHDMQMRDRNKQHDQQALKGEIKEMKKFLSYLSATLLVISLVLNVALSEDGIDLSLPESMPENYLQYCWVGGIETNGVTFVVENASRERDSLKIMVLQLPNDDYTSLIDNQVDCEPSDYYFIKEKETASLYGKKLLGTLCDILAATDENGNDLLQEYMISTDRNSASLTYEFTIYLPPENEIKKVNIEFIFGVNEDLRSRFPMSDSMNISISLVE